jgi:SsrA-binding protein
LAVKVVTNNRKAYHNFTVEDSLEAGLALTGTEIKSIRDGKVNLNDAYVKPEGGDLWLLNAYIARYDPGSYMSHEPTRNRRLLMHRKQINLLTGRVQERGLTIVPLKIYLKDGLAKLEIALGKGKKLYDKREAIAERDSDREIDRAVKSQRF